MVLLVVGGVLLLGSIMWPWTATGLGSTQSGRALADLLLSGTISSWVPQWAGLCLYAPPVCGSLLLIAAGIGARSGQWLAVGALTVAATTSCLVAAALSWTPLSSPGVGALLVAGGLISGVISSILGAPVPRHGRAQP